MERDGDYPVAIALAHVVSGFGDDRNHARIAGEDVGDEASDLPFAGRGCQVVLQHRSDALPVVAIGDVKGNLAGAASFEAVEAADPDDRFWAHHGDRQPVTVLNDGEW